MHKNMENTYTTTQQVLQSVQDQMQLVVSTILLAQATQEFTRALLLLLVLCTDSRWDSCYT